MSTVIEHLGHTAFSVQHDSTRILIDPILVRENLEFRRPTCPRWFFSELSTLDAVFISHGHDDHLHPPSLLGLPSATPIYYLDEDVSSCSCVDLPERLLTGLGFTNVVPFKPGNTIAFAGGSVKIHVIPAQSSSEGEEQCCFLIETDDVLALDAVDIPDGPETRAALEPLRERIDIAFLPTGAAIQWQGFWNQMDIIEAVRFSEWLGPAKVASCGGALSLAAPQRRGSLERYPKDATDWFTIASERLERERLLLERPPYQLVFEAHELRQVRTMQQSSRTGSGTDDGRASALLTTYVTGYHPRLPTKQWFWPHVAIEEWLGELHALADVLQASRRQLAKLLARCTPESVRAPLGVLAPSTLRHLMRSGAIEAAAHACSFVPRPPSDPLDLDMGFFAMLEAILEDATMLEASVRADLRTCMWIDRNVYQLQIVQKQMAASPTLAPDVATKLRQQHREKLLATLDERRPVFHPHHIRLTPAQARLLNGARESDKSEYLCFVAPNGVHLAGLSAIESLLLQQCDGRTVRRIVAELASYLRLEEGEVRQAFWSFLTRLSEESVLLIDWSR